MLIVSDTHIDSHRQFTAPENDPIFPGCNARAVQLLRALERAYFQARDTGHEYVILAGDVFHRRGILDVPTFNAACRIVKEAREFGVKTIAIPGNHDFVDREADGAVDEKLHGLFALSGATVANSPTLYRLEEKGATYALCALPYTPRRDRWVSEAKRLATAGAKIPNSTVIVLGHQSFDGAKIGPHEHIMKEGISPEDLPGADFHFSGHYHLHQTLGDGDRKLTYVGSIAQHNFGERGYVPGWIEVTRDGWSHVENLITPRFRKITTNDVETVEKALVAAQSGDYVHVDWSGDPRVGDDLSREIASVPTLEVSCSGVSTADASARVALDPGQPLAGLLESYVGFLAERGDELPLPQAQLIERGRALAEKASRDGRI